MKNHILFVCRTQYLGQRFCLSTSLRVRVGFPKPAHLEREQPPRDIKLEVTLICLCTLKVDY